MTKTKVTKKSILTKLKALGPVTPEQRNNIVCSLIGHSNIVTGFFGYFYCGRCGNQIGDSLGGYWNNPDCVLVGHNCETCQENYKRLTWRDKLFAPDPFKENTK